MKYTLFTTLFLWSTGLLAQTRTYTVSFYYNINQVQPAGLQRLDSLYETWHSGSHRIEIYGYADFLSGDKYNLELSQKRADWLKAYLQSKGLGNGLVISSCSGVGEKYSVNNQSKSGEPSQRRADLIVTSSGLITKKISANENVTQEKQPEPDNPAAEENISVEAGTGLENLEKGESLTIEGLTFIPGRHMVTPAAFPAMKKLLHTLRKHPEIKIEIQGHVCCPDDGEPDGFDMDSHKYNLSEMRALAIYNFLVKNGIEKKRLSYKGYGRTRPKVPLELSEEDKQKNRRVDIKILEN